MKNKHVTPDNNEQAIKIISHYFDDDERPASLILEELDRAAEQLKHVTIKLLPHQRQALLSLLADIEGGHAKCRRGSFATSELLKAINAKQIQRAASEMFQFVYVHGRVSQRLWEKRTVEQGYYRRGSLSLK